VTEQELREVRERQAHGTPPSAGVWGVQAHEDRGALLAHVADLEAVLHDALHEGGVELGRRLGLGEALACLEREYLYRWEKAAGYDARRVAEGVRHARDVLRALGPAPDTAPPAGVRAANEALRRHLETCVGAWFGTGDSGLSPGACLAAARAYLRGEGA
jgi:hypothetical protein